MTRTQEYLHAQIVETLQKALGLPVVDVQFTEGQMQVQFDTTGPGMDSPFWAAVKEQWP